MKVMKFKRKGMKVDSYPKTEKFMIIKKRCSLFCITRLTTGMLNMNQESSKTPYCLPKLKKKNNSLLWLL